MATWLQKSMIGFKELSSRHDEKGEATHVRLSASEYDKLRDKISSLEDEIADTTIKANDTIDKVKSNALAYGKKKDEEASEKVNKAEAELVEALQERNYQIELNKNLMRINRERSNADRRLQPKKKHSGYIVIQSQEKAIKYAVRRSYVSAICWETTIQSPYSVDFFENIARREIQTELNESIAQELGLYIYLTEDCAEIYTDEQCKDFNMLFQMRLRANYKGGYWEVIIVHTRPLENVPKHLRQ